MFGAVAAEAEAVVVLTPKGLLLVVEVAVAAKGLVTVFAVDKDEKEAEAEGVVVLTPNGLLLVVAVAIAAKGLVVLSLLFVLLAGAVADDEVSVELLVDHSRDDGAGHSPALPLEVGQGLLPEVVDLPQVDIFFFFFN